MVERFDGFATAPPATRLMLDAPLSSAPAVVRASTVPSVRLTPAARRMSPPPLATAALAAIVRLPAACRSALSWRVKTRDAAPSNRSRPASKDKASAWTDLS